MAKQIIATATAPSAIGPYSQAVKVGSTVYLSGQIGLDPATSDLVGADFEAQVRQAFKNLAEVAKAAGGSLAHAVKFTLFLTDLGQFARSTRSWVKWCRSRFRRDPPSASRACPRARSSRSKRSSCSIEPGATQPRMRLRVPPRPGR
jgi:reactive intermediate/imine deaminase